MTQITDIAALERALADLGAALAQHDEHFTLFVIGGSAYLLQEPERARATSDLDVAAMVLADGALVRPVPLPRTLADMAAAVGRLHGLGAGWINSAAAASFDNLIPDGALERATRRTWGGLTLLVASRDDLIRLKFQAAQRRGSMGDRYRDDLVRMHPTAQELQVAMEWLVATAPDPDSARERARVVFEQVRSTSDG